MIQKHFSYSTSDNDQLVLKSDPQPSAEDCSSSCADMDDCERFTWQIGNEKKCWLFKSDSITGTYEFGSYSGLPRQKGDVQKN